jgi:hypothetical protein
MTIMQASRAASIALDLISGVKDGTSPYGSAPLPEDQLRCLARAFGEAMSAETVMNALTRPDYGNDDPLAALAEYVSQIYALGFSTGARWMAADSTKDQESRRGFRQQ